MKIGFYAAYAEDGKKNKYSIDVLSFLLQKITQSQQISLDCNDYYLYLHLIDPKTILFTKTNDSNLIQKINRSKSSVEEIRKSLASDESLGFASFIYFDDSIIGFARSMYGPTTSDLICILSKEKMPIPASTKIIVEPLMRGTTKADVQKMHFIGRTTVKVEASSGLSEGILKLLGAKNIEGELLDSLEIVIKPKFKRNIKSLTKEIVNNPNKQYSDVAMRAKDEAGDVLADHYLTEKGHLSATIHKATNAEIAEEIEYGFARMKKNILEVFANQVGKLK
ncbi:protein rexA [Erwinia sp. S38]|uniref:protein rexA n=1 Tax=Erwinia sp. S38 TaxID=2769338 RepID=UPI00190A1248|nr:protein rexA [Erwinia sp. S38]MBK0001436.1 protein rexA [Erwinia sp. S38]